VILAWIWSAQTHYDTRFQAEDSLHRLAKGLQITVFLYIGAASGNWDLSLMLLPSSGAEDEGADESDAAQGGSCQHRGYRSHKTQYMRASPR
jgi:hypothetical protein